MIVYVARRLILMVRHRMMRIGRTHLRIRALAQLARHHEGENTRSVGLPGYCQQVEQQRHVFVERIGYADGRIRCVHLSGAASFLPLDAPLDFAKIIQIIVHSSAIARAQARPQVIRFLDHRAQNTPLLLDAGLPIRCRPRRSEQPFENCPRINLHR